MVAATLIGCMFIALAFPISLYFAALRKSPKLTVVVVSGAFAWLLSLLISSAIWNAGVTIKNEGWWAIIIAVPLQELFRYLFWRLLKKAERGMNILAIDNGQVITHERLALASGLGFSLMSVAINYNITLEAAGGPGTLTAPGCPSLSFFTVSAMIGMCFGVLHVFWGILAHAGWEGRLQNKTSLSINEFKVAFVLLGHLLASFLTLNNKSGTCVGTLVPLYILTAVTVLLAYQSSNVSLFGVRA